ncbi:FMN-dependent dehydrogenase-domain-containing protein [Fimicolochytrium jonesii]|uniref:FMN-dependent dehydrogenase-domain-containing protein n=1 Tax=Fimicolochytrium jonesii TaxID=1396493 RepID=UPI0022FDB6C2|nr:FMN-dependent dehydrogenase-domain-containing protein [Fimicolochytrium jonesii]KAI8821380.1 FMN-dependent dehydrogenase-domain-containing protein [Fimicolochytrium jonesii]
MSPGKTQDGRVIDYQELQRHNKATDCWVALHGQVYDLTSFLDEHPGGRRLILAQAGTDGTEAFEEVHSKDVISRTLSPETLIGALDQETVPEKAVKLPGSQPKGTMAEEGKPDLARVLNMYEFEYIARKTMKKGAWNYYSSGTDDEITLRENTSAFQRVWLIPRVLVDVSRINFETTILGYPSSAPFYMTATALGKLGHMEGELALTRAAGKSKIIHMLPTLSSFSLDEMTAVRGPDQVQFFQLYVNKDRKITERIVKQAEARGCKALFITVDAPALGNREKDMRTKFVDDRPAEMEEKDVKRSEGAARAISTFIDDTLCWADIPWFKRITHLPIVLKGIQCAADAVLAAQHGVAGIVLSNHGGRQLETARSGLEILPEVMAALKSYYADHPGPEMEVYIDGGVRRATDVIKALAMGAKAVGIGRPFLYAMSAYGQPGVEKAIQLLKDEMNMALRLLGAPTLAHLRPDMVDARNLGLHVGPPIRNYLSEAVYEPLAFGNHKL